MIEIEDVHKRYGDVVALDGLSLFVSRGASVGLVGTNGAGKTTLFRLLVGLERPDAGTVRVAGRDPTAGLGVRERVGYLPEDVGFQPALTGREVLADHARMRGVAASDSDSDIDGLLETVGLAEAADRRVGGYSNGMGRRLALATALLADPAVLLLDEPTAGLDPGGVAAFNDVLERVRETRDVTVLLSSHVLDEVERLCDHVAFIENGRTETTGSVSALSHAADQPTTITARYDSADAAEQAANRLRTNEPVTCHRDGDVLELTCDEQVAVDVVSATIETDPVGLGVSEPTLSDAFRERILGGESA